MKKLLMTIAMTLAVSNAFAGYVETNHIPNIKMMNQVYGDQSKNHDILINVNEILYFSVSDTDIVQFFLIDKHADADAGIFIRGTMQQVLDKILDKKCINEGKDNDCSMLNVENSNVSLYEQPDFAVIRDDSGDITTAFNINKIKYITSKISEGYNQPPQVTTTIIMGNANSITMSLSLIELYQIIYKIPSPMIDILPPACLKPLGCD